VVEGATEVPIAGAAAAPAEPEKAGSAPSSNELDGTPPVIIAGVTGAPGDAVGGVVTGAVLPKLVPCMLSPPLEPAVGVLGGNAETPSLPPRSAASSDEPQPIPAPLASTSMQSTRIHARFISSSHAAGLDPVQPPGCNRCASV
jgi:hypothetical protein